MLQTTPLIDKLVYQVVVLPILQRNVIGKSNFFRLMPYDLVTCCQPLKAKFGWSFAVATLGLVRWPKNSSRRQSVPVLSTRPECQAKRFDSSFSGCRTRSPNLSDIASISRCAMVGRRLSQLSHQFFVESHMGHEDGNFSPECGAAAEKRQSGKCGVIIADNVDRS